MLTTIFGLAAIALILIAIFQIAKANELAIALKDEVSVMRSNNKLHAVLWLVFLVGFLGLTYWSTVHYQHLFLPPASSVHGKWIENMFFWTMLATVPVFILTHIVLCWFAFKYKDDGKNKAYYYPGSNQLEIIWTAIPAIVMVFLVVEGMRNWYKITGPAPQDALVVEVTGKQFAWTIRYSGKDNQLGAKTVKLIGDNNELGQDWKDAKNADDFIANDIHLPVGKPVLFKINSIDVLHSFYLPHFKVKMDAVPGIPTQFWFTPTQTTDEMKAQTGKPNFEFELACAELCGAAHYNMRKSVIVETEESFKKWFAEQKPILEGVKEQNGGRVPEQPAIPGPAKNPYQQHEPAANPHEGDGHSKGEEAQPATGH
jgi:cytochrome c oxidase subunit 2